MTAQCRAKSRQSGRHTRAHVITCTLDLAALAGRGYGGHVGNDDHAACEHEFVACPCLLHRVVAEDHL